MACRSGLGHARRVAPAMPSTIPKVLGMRYVEQGLFLDRHLRSVMEAASEFVTLAVPKTSTKRALQAQHSR